MDCCFCTIFGRISYTRSLSNASKLVFYSITLRWIMTDDYQPNWSQYKKTQIVHDLNNSKLMRVVNLIPIADILHIKHLIFFFKNFRESDRTYRCVKWWFCDLIMVCPHYDLVLFDGPATTLTNADTVRTEKSNPKRDANRLQQVGPPL